MVETDNTSTETNMKLTHQPATKVAGRRVAGHKEYKNESSNDAIREVLDYELPAKMDHAYPTESVKRIHEKPTPAVQQTHVNRGTSGGQQRFIPRKQTH
ncbi:hypothetical protein GCK72_019699 [Caenorhabditis remanei]|uniref:Uncharacterized protein n=1 Tax=Caenorhabditis remanei TaxID=31234 RepID=A0A6A5GEQ2_CAERE|nr:hypothetical protein GCK72_019699 [Caenorhabditis remanei]KAF1753143.1 hypothetical protein GCK72_019699 [Caenorhabditis remanei]